MGGDSRSNGSTSKFMISSVHGWALKVAPPTISELFSSNIISLTRCHNLRDTVLVLTAVNQKGGWQKPFPLYHYLHLSTYHNLEGLKIYQRLRDCRLRAFVELHECFRYSF